MKNSSRTLKSSKCFNGLNEWMIESDGSIAICSAGKVKIKVLKPKIQHYNYNLMKLFRSKPAREFRRNCKKCKIKCQQLVYFRPSSDRLLPIIKDLILLYTKLFIYKLRKLFNLQKN